MRESPQIDLARRILEKGYDLSIYDASVKPEQLIGQNLGYAYSQLPTIGELLISREDVEQRTFDLVIDASGHSKQLAFKAARVVDISSLQRTGTACQP